MRDCEDNYESHKGELAVVFRITEGPQTLVKNLVIEGNNGFTTEAARTTAEQRSGAAVQRSRHHERPRCADLLLLQPRISGRAV